ncbi:MAG: multiheme c-type cytochrome [Pseudomonadota bacterium]
MNQTSTSNQLNRESRLVSWLALLGIICAISGALITLFRTGFSDWYQWNLIGHALVGSVIVLPLSIYTVIHFRRTVGIRKPAILFSGLLASALIFLALGSGIWLALVGSEEAISWVTNAHALFTYTTIALTLIHLVLHRRYRSVVNRKRERVFITVNKSSMTNILSRGIIAYFLGVAAVTLGYGYYYQSPKMPIPDDYQSDYGEHPFRPSQTETADQALVHVNQIAKSQQCGSCHEDIFKQWLSSAHRQAASDPAYVKNINLLANNKGIVATRYCEGCHAPVALLTGELTEGGKHGGIANTPAHLEGVGCMGCHGIESVHDLNGTASYLFSTKENYLFDSTTSALGQKLRNFLIQAAPRKHKESMAADILSDPRICASCHEQFMDKSMNNWGWVKMQSTYQEWLESPFSGQDNQLHSEQEVTRCQDCHFPKVRANDPSADVTGMVSSHRSLGANTVLPMLSGDVEHFEKTKQFLQSSKLLVHIDKPETRNLVTNDQFVDQSLNRSDGENTPYFLYLEQSASLSVSVTNRLVGHHFPAGTNDINQAWLYMVVKDGNGRTLFESGALDEKNFLDKQAITYHSIPVDRHGKEVWKHDLFRMTGEVYRNSIPSGQTDINSFEFKVPSWAKSPLTAEAVVKYRKFNQRYAQWALETPNPGIPIIDVARDTLTISLREQVDATDRSNAGE